MGGETLDGHSIMMWKLIAKMRLVEISFEEFK